MGKRKLSVRSITGYKVFRGKLCLELSNGYLVTMGAVETIAYTNALRARLEKKHLSLQFDNMMVDAYGLSREECFKLADKNYLEFSCNPKRL